MGGKIGALAPHLEVLPREQLEVWRACPAPAAKWHAYLAGGTALALHLGHRRSIDFDWFTADVIPPGELLADVERMGFPVSVIQNDAGTFLATVSGVSFTVFRYRYRLLEPTIEVERCALASMRDLAAMKLLATYQRGTKKDFVDIFELLARGGFTLPEMLDAFRAKFDVTDVREMLRALTYFADADPLPMPDMIAQRSWDEVKAGLREHVAKIGAPAGSPTSRRRRRRR